AVVLFFFFQAEDGIRDFHVTGVQTCALPISRHFGGVRHAWIPMAEVRHLLAGHETRAPSRVYDELDARPLRSVTQARVALGTRQIGRASCRERGYNTGGARTVRDMNAERRQC